jgi:hypothetical protein
LDKFDSSVWNGFKKLKESKSIEFAYVDLGALFAAIQDNPSSFGSVFCSSAPAVLDDFNF